MILDDIRRWLARLAPSERRNTVGRYALTSAEATQLVHECDAAVERAYERGLRTPRPAAMERKAAG